MARLVDVLTTPVADAPDFERFASPTRSFTLTSTEGEGLQLDGLKPMSRLIVHTRHSSYRLVVRCCFAVRALKGHPVRRGFSSAAAWSSRATRAAS